MRHLLPGALGVFAALTGCVQDDGSVFIENALILDQSGDCTATASSKPLSNGIFDILHPEQGYKAALKVRTNLPATFTNADVSKSDSQAPNYPDYGATDNNVIIFQSASVKFTTVTDDDTAAALQAGKKFKCDGNTCTVDGSESLISGSVFNVNTSLSTDSVAFLEAISAAEAVTFAEAFAGVLTKSTNRQRVVAEIRVQGTTTGAGALRPVTSFPFPLAIDLCRGCLVPDNAFCDDVVEVESPVISRAQDVAEPQVCFDGQDFPSTECECIRVNNNNTETPLGAARNDSCL